MLQHKIYSFKICVWTFSYFNVLAPTGLSETLSQSSSAQFEDVIFCFIHPDRATGRQRIDFKEHLYVCPIRTIQSSPCTSGCYIQHCHLKTGVENRFGRLVESYSHQSREETITKNLIINSLLLWSPPFPSRSLSSPEPLQYRLGTFSAKSPVASPLVTINSQKWILGFMLIPKLNGSCEYDLNSMVCINCVKIAPGKRAMYIFIVMWVEHIGPVLKREGDRERECMDFVTK